MADFHKMLADNYKNMQKMMKIPRPITFTVPDYFEQKIQIAREEVTIPSPLTEGALLILKPGDIPEAVRKINIAYYLPSLESSIFPKEVTHMIFRDAHKYESLESIIPQSVTHVNLDNFFPDTPGTYICPRIIKCTPIPEGVTHIKIGGSCDVNISEVVPISTTHLYFENYYARHKIKDYSKHINIQHLCTTYSRDRVILPPNLKYLYLMAKPNTRLELDPDAKIILPSSILGVYGVKYPCQSFEKGTAEFDKYFEIDHSKVKSAIN